MSRRWVASLLLCATSLAAAATRTDAQARTETPRGTSTLVVLVRHAEKAALPADDPAISEAGQLRARALADALLNANITAVITSPRRRTIETAAPLAQARHLTPEIVALDTGHVNAVAAAVRKHVGGVVLVVGHSNTIPAIIAALGGPKFPDLCDGVYSSLFVLEIAAPERGATGVKAPVPLVRSQFGAADAPGADQCRAMSPK